MEDIINILFNDIIYLLSILTILGGIILLNGILSGKITRLWRNLVDRIKGRHKIYVKTQKVISKINNNLSALRGHTNADRAYIFEFHNGNDFASTLPQWKISQTYEKVGSGITHEGQNLQNLPATLVWDDFLKMFFVDKVTDLPTGTSFYVENPHCQCKGNYSMPRGAFLTEVAAMYNSVGPVKTILEQQAVSYTLQTAIFTSQRRIVGFVGLDYCKVLDFEDIEKYLDPCALCKFAAQVSLDWELNNTMKNRLMVTQKKIWNK